MHELDAAIPLGLLCETRIAGAMAAIAGGVGDSAGRVGGSGIRG